MPEENGMAYLKSEKINLSGENSISSVKFFKKQRQNERKMKARIKIKWKSKKWESQE